MHRKLPSVELASFLKPIAYFFFTACFLTHLAQKIFFGYTATMQQQKNALVILGATATGKTALAVACAKKFSGEIISADSRQVYRELTIGSGKDLTEYTGVPYHLIDICDLHTEYNVFNFQRDCVTAFDKIVRKKKLPIIAGGTGLYLNSILQQYALLEVPVDSALRSTLETKPLEELEAILKNLNPKLHNTTDLEDRQRAIRAIEIAQFKIAHAQKTDDRQTETPTPITPLVFKITFDRSVLRKRIRNRLETRLDEGLIDEVRNCVQQYGEQRILKLGLEYKYTTLFLKGEYTYEEYVEKLFTAICQFAKRQETWFRKMEREGVAMIPLDGTDKEQMLRTIEKYKNIEL